MRLGRPVARMLGVGKHGRVVEGAARNGVQHLPAQPHRKLDIGSRHRQAQRFPSANAFSSKRDSQAAATHPFADFDNFGQSVST